MGVFIIVLCVGCWIFGFAVGRNNPNYSAVNRAIAAGKVIIAAVNKLIKKL